MGRRWSWWSKRRNGITGGSTRVNSVVLQEEGLSPLQTQEEKGHEHRVVGTNDTRGRHEEEVDIADRRLFARYPGGV